MLNIEISFRFGEPKHQEKVVRKESANFSVLIVSICIRLGFAAEKEKQMAACPSTVVYYVYTYSIHLYKDCMYIVYLSLIHI